MSADIMAFIPRRNRKSVLTDFYAPKAAPDDLVMDHVDTAPCEYAPRHCEEQSDEAIQ
jgi:hypothetical protein